MMAGVREPIPAPRRSGFTSSTSAPLYWCAYGPVGAPRLLILHGGPGADHEYLLPQFLDLADEYELIFYDQRGGGRSKSDDRTPVTWQLLVRDLALLINELALSPASVVGYSWGGMLALLHALEARQERINAQPARLALVDPAPLTSRYRKDFDTEFARRQQAPELCRLRDELASSGLRSSDPARYRQRAFELSVAPYFAEPSRATELTPFRVTGRVQQSVWESLGDFNVIRDLGTLRCPSLVVHGREDPIPLASSQAAAEALRAELVPLDACGHVPYVEARSELFAALRSFLRRTSDSDTE